MGIYMKQVIVLQSIVIAVASFEKIFTFKSIIDVAFCLKRKKGSFDCTQVWS